MRVLTIFAPHRHATAEQELFDLFRDQLPSVRRDVVVVDTALPLGVAEEEQGRLVMGGDNSAREFSAFDSGVARVGEKIWDYDLVNLTTAAFRQMYWDYLERFQPATLDAIAGRPVWATSTATTSRSRLPDARASIGSARPASSCPLSNSRFSGAWSPYPTPWFSGDPSNPFRSDAPLSPGYRRLIIDWLTGQDIGQGVSGIPVMALTPTTPSSSGRRRPS